MYDRYLRPATVKPSLPRRISVYGPTVFGAMLIGYLASAMQASSMASAGLLLASTVGAVAAACIRSPEAMVLAYVATRPLVDVAVHAQLGPLTLGQLWGAGLLLILLVYWLAFPGARRDYVPRPSAAVPCAFVGAYIALALSRGPLLEALLSTSRLGSWIAFVFAATAIARAPRGQRALVRAMLTMGWLLTAAVVYLGATGHYGGAYYARTDAFSEPFLSLGQGPHGLAQMAVFLLPFPLIAVMTGHHKMEAIVLAACLSLCIIFSFVRSAYVGSAFILLGYVLIILQSTRTRLMLAFAMVLCTITAGAYATRAILSERFADIAQIASSTRPSAFAGGRLEFWDAVLDWWLASSVNFISGGGVTTSYGVVRSRIGHSLWAHNDVLEMLATGGIVLAVLFCALYWWLFSTVSYPRRAGGEGSATIRLGVIGTFTVAAFLVMGILNGVALGQSCLPFAALVGLVRGVKASEASAWP